MTYHGKSIWIEESERKNREIAGLDEKDRELYLKGYREATKFWLGLEEKGFIDVHIGKRYLSLSDELDDSD